MDLKSASKKPWYRGKIRRSLRFSYLDGIFASCMSGFTADYITPYALFFKASASQIGILSAMPNLVSALVQLRSPELAERFKSRCKMVNLFVFLHVLVGLPLILLPFIACAHKVFFLIALVTLFSGFNAVALPAWSSVMSDYVPHKMRGRYFGWRNKRLSTIAIIASLTAGFILHLFRDNVLYGFLIIFCMAIICRFISWYFLTRMYEPPLKVNKEDYFSFFDFIKRLKESNYAKFVVSSSCLYFSVYLASPFFSVFMLRDLKFGYLTYTIVVIAATAAGVIAVSRWGSHADKVGNLKIMKLTSFFTALLPGLWLLNRNPVFLIFVQLIGGFAWAGFNLCAVNFVFDSAKPEKRTRCMAYFNVCTGFAISMGALTGGYLVNIVPEIMGYRILCLFLISCVLRLIVGIFFFGRIKEVRHTQDISHQDLFFSVSGIKDLQLFILSCKKA